MSPQIQEIPIVTTHDSRSLLFLHLPLSALSFLALHLPPSLSLYLLLFSFVDHEYGWVWVESLLWREIYNFKESKLKSRGEKEGNQLWRKRRERTFDNFKFLIHLTKWENKFSKIGENVAVKDQRKWDFRFYEKINNFFDLRSNFLHSHS